MEAWFLVDFRKCIEGEEFVNNMCLECDTGQFALKINELCKPCLENVVCLGGNKLSLNKGFWRDSLNREEILRCFEFDACEGGFYLNTTYPVKCGEGYQGVMCHDCVYNVTSGQKFMRSGRSKCSVCPNEATNTLRIVGFILLILGGIFILVVFNI